MMTRTTQKHIIIVRVSFYHGSKLTRRDRGVGTGGQGVHVPLLVEEGDIACICTPAWIDQMESLAF